MDNIFKGYISNTLAAFGQQNAFAPERADMVYIGRVFYRIYSAGQYAYRLYFCNTIDSTFADGSFCHPNELCCSWQLEYCRVGICDSSTVPQNAVFDEMTRVKFNGSESKTVMPGEIFPSDEFTINAQKGDYLCLEIAFKGSKIPYLAEAIATIPTFVKNGDRWESNVKTPGAFLVGCNRRVKKHIAFLGDSITMGCGTSFDKYTHWAACIADIVGENYGWWNLGIGYARCADAATDGVWLFKAKQADIVNVCLGTNDLLRGARPEDVVKNLHIVVEKLLCAGCEVGIFTLPPFDYSGEAVAGWEYVNNCIRNDFQGRVKYIYDTCTVLDSPGENHGKGKYNPHPDDKGCRLLAEDFVRFLKQQGILENQ